MSYNARIRSMQRRAGGMYGHDRGWEVGSNQSSAIGISPHLVNRVSARTTPKHIIDGVEKDDRNLVVQQNTLSGVGRYRSQFNVEAGGIKYERYYFSAPK